MMAPVNALDRLGRPPALAALDGEDDVWVVGGAVRDALLDRAPHELDLVVEGDAVAVARRVAERLGGGVDRPRALRDGHRALAAAMLDLAAARRETLRAAGGAARRRARRDDRARTSPARLHGQRDRRAARRRRSCVGHARRARRTSTSACCGCCTPRSFVDDPTRLLRSPATPRGWASRPIRTTDALARGTATRRDRDRRPSRRRAAAAAARAAAGGAARALAARGSGRRCSAASTPRAGADRARDRS